MRLSIFLYVDEPFMFSLLGDACLSLLPSFYCLSFSQSFMRVLYIVWILIICKIYVLQKVLCCLAYHSLVPLDTFFIFLQSALSTFMVCFSLIDFCGLCLFLKKFFSTLWSWIHSSTLSIYLYIYICMLISMFNPLKIVLCAHYSVSFIFSSNG